LPCSVSTGQGKTTTIKMLSCLTKSTSGDAVILGKSILTESQAVKKIANVSPQETAVAPNLSVQKNLELIAATGATTFEDAFVALATGSEANA